jgi:tetratricopeptide (TPR) repeat protein
VSKLSHGTTPTFVKIYNITKRSWSKFVEITIKEVLINKKDSFKIVKSIDLKYHYFLFLFFSFFLAQAQSWTGELDQSSDVLLKNRYVEIEAAQAMFDMYNMDFDQAERQFKYLKKQYGWHPLPDFLLGLCYWWRLVPQGEMGSKWDQLFLAQMDSAQVKAHRLYDEVNQIEGAFFLAAAYGFQGRLYADRGQYLKASLAGKNALKYLNIGKDEENFSPELLLGKGLFNYYAQWIPEHYPMLKPIMTFFPKGDKSVGIAQLKETSRNAFYARTEAQYYLLRILYEEEQNLSEASQLAAYLTNLYPNNSYFQSYYGRILYRLGKQSESIAVFESILERIHAEQEGYEYNTARYATYFLGNIWKARGDLTKSKKYFKESVKYAALANATEKGYYFYSLLHLGEIAVLEKEFDLALQYFKKVRKVTGRKHAVNRSAKEKMKEIEH